MKELKQTIIKTFEQDSKRSWAVKDLTAELSMKSAKKFKELVQALAELERERKIALLPDGTFQLSGQAKIFTGIFRATDHAFGFVTVEDFEDDVFIGPNDTLGALNNDQVEIEITKEAQPWKDQAAEGRVLEIKERGLTQLVGVFTPYNDAEVKETGFIGKIKPNDRKLQKMQVVLSSKGLHPVDGEVILADVVKYPKNMDEAMIVIGKKIIGHVNDPGVEITSIAYKHDIHTEFPDEVLEEINQIPEKVLPEEYEGRKDLRDKYTFTIDGADAKDLDDAISIEKLSNGNYELGVHIADVSHYVREGTALDEEAFARGVSSYLVDRVIPMLPPKLSNGICSLFPNVDRLTMSCLMEINKKGQVVNYEITPSVIQSKKRLTYDLVNELLSPEVSMHTVEEYQEVLLQLKQMKELHEILERERHQRGALEFETPEIEFELDEQGHPVAIHMRERLVAERLIESFMLIANETVATHYVRQDVPFLYRVHEHPDSKKIQRFITFAARFGLQVPRVKDQVAPKTLQKVLEQIQGEPSEPVISMLMLRSMQQARYEVKPLGHYGLASEYYSHFTAPIRRYPDLMLHRLIHKYEEGVTEKEIKKLEKELPEIADYTSKAERRAIDAEREVDDLKKAQYMEDKVGEQYEGIIVSVTNFGMFVQLPNMVEGLVHVSDMKDDYYEFVEDHLMMVGTRTGKVYRMGDVVEIEVADVDVKQYKIDFKLLESKATSANENGKQHAPHQKGKGRGKGTARKKGTPKGKGSFKKSTKKGARSHSRRGKGKQGKKHSYKLRRK